MNTKVSYPNGTSETKKTMKMGEWMMAGYDLAHTEKYQMMILFKTMLLPTVKTNFNES